MGIATAVAADFLGLPWVGTTVCAMDRTAARAVDKTVTFAVEAP